MKIAVGEHTIVCSSAHKIPQKVQKANFFTVEPFSKSSVFRKIWGFILKVHVLYREKRHKKALPSCVKREKQGPSLAMAEAAMLDLRACSANSHAKEGDKRLLREFGAGHKRFDFCQPS